MKKRAIILIILSLLPLAATLIALPFLPESVPVHYNAAGEVDRWGSKHEMLLTPAITIGMGALMLLIARITHRSDVEERGTGKVVLLAGILSAALLGALAIYFLYTAFRQVERLNETPFDVCQITFGLLGLSLIPVGNVMPKLHRNALIGLRTSWSMKNDAVWKRSQRIGGIAFIIAGAAMVVIACLTKELVCTALCMGVMAAAAVAALIGSWYAAKTDITESSAMK